MSTKSPERSNQQPLATAYSSSTNEGKQEKAKGRSGGAFGWWYRLTAPDIPPPNAPFAQLEIVRRGRLASIILFFVLLLGILAAPSIIKSSTDLAAPLSHLASILINIIALFFNRRGKVTIAGILVVASVTLGFTVGLVFPGHIGVSSLPLFELLALPELIAVSLLPPGSVFIVALIYSLFVWFDLSFLPHAPDLDQLLAQFRYGLILEPILLYVLVAVVTFLWVRGAMQALKRADRAEEIAVLERREVERQQQEIEQKRQLDLGIQQILKTHVQVANGNFQVRAPLTRENILWQIAYSLNNLVARLQGYAQDELELRRVREHAAHLLEAVRQARDNNHPIWVKRESTFLDPIALELNGLYPESSRKRPDSRLNQRAKMSGE